MNGPGYSHCSRLGLNISWRVIQNFIILSDILGEMHPCVLEMRSSPMRVYTAYSWHIHIVYSLN